MCSNFGKILTILLLNFCIIEIYFCNISFGDLTQENSNVTLDMSDPDKLLHYFCNHISPYSFQVSFIFLIRNYIFAAIVPYFVTVILTYHGVTEEAIPDDVVTHASEDAGSGVAIDLILQSNNFEQILSK